MDRSISPLPNLPSQSLKLSNKLTGSLRSQSPSQPGRPAKKKKKATVKEKSPASLHVASHDPVTQQEAIVGQAMVGHHKMKSDRPKPPSSSYTTSQTSFSSSLSSSESDMEEVSMPTLSTMTTAAAAIGDGNGMVGSLKRGKSSDSSSSASNSSSSESQSDDDSDEVMLHHLHQLVKCVCMHLRWRTQGTHLLAGHPCQYYVSANHCLYMSIHCLM